METKEKIHVYARIVKGHTVCICMANKKRCEKHCSKEVVERDRFAGWEDTFKRDRYGKSR